VIRDSAQFVRAQVGADAPLTGRPVASVVLPPPMPSGEEMDDVMPATRRVTRAQLYDSVWSRPMRDIARDLGISDVGLAKLCRRHSIPTPERGHWAKPKHGKRVERRPLPTLEPGDAELIELPPLLVSGQSASIPKEVIGIEVQPELKDPHPLVERTEASLRGARADEHGRVTPRAQRALPVTVAPSSVDRAMRVLDALVKTLESRGHLVGRTVLDGRDRLAATVSHETVGIEFSEELDREVRELTRAEQAEKAKYPWLHSSVQYRRFPSGRLSLRIDHADTLGLRKHWADGSRQRVERCLDAFVLQLERFAEAIKRQRAERGEAERRRRAWEMERYEKLRQIGEEEERVRTLERQAEQWRKSQEVRQFIEAVRVAGSSGSDGVPQGSDLQRWLEWASAHADRMDPLVKSPPSILDEKGRWGRSYFSASTSSSGGIG
jgi:hypothetical protein